MVFDYTNWAVCLSIQEVPFIRADSTEITIERGPRLLQTASNVTADIRNVAQQMVMGITKRRDRRQ
jgi:hypothetical protein